MKPAINLCIDDAVAQGGEKIVFHHPTSEDLLIKVVNPKYVNHMNKNWPISTRFRRLSHYWFYINELTEHVFSREAKMDNKHFIQNIVGLIDTNLGLGMVVKTVKKSNGDLAESLKNIIDQKRYSEQHHQAITEFMRWLDDHYIIVRDLTAANIVWDECNEHFVLIDGIGARRLPSLRSFSKRYNQYGNRKRTTKLKFRLNKQLKSNQLAFSF